MLADQSRLAFLAAAVLGVAATCGAQNVPSAARLDELELSELLDAVSSRQDSLVDCVQGRFTVRSRIEQKEVSRDDLSGLAQAHQERAVVEGTLEWVRCGNRKFVELRFDLPNALCRDEFVDRRVVDDGTRQVTTFIRSKQALVTPSRDLATVPIPEDWLLAGCRRTFRSLREAGTRFEGRRRPDGTIELRFLSPDDASEVEAVVSPELEFSLVEWAYGSCDTRCTLEYERDKEGLLLFKGGVITQSVADQRGRPMVRRWSIETQQWMGAASPSDGRFRFAPAAGTLITDYVADPQEVPAYFRAEPDGTLRRLPKVQVLGTMSASGRATAVGFAGAIILGLLLLRLRYVGLHRRTY